MRLLKSAFVAAALALASPGWAHGGHGHGHKHGHHHGWDDRRDRAEWRHHRHHGRFDDRRYFYSQHNYYQPYYRPYPVYVPSPGVHIVVPNIYIPLR